MADGIKGSDSGDLFREDQQYDMPSNPQVDLPDEGSDEAHIEAISVGTESENRHRATSLVTSVGCSRAFITCVLARALEHVKGMRTTSSISFPFPTSDVEGWLKLAAQDCLSNKEYQLALGGTQFDAANPCTHWTSSIQFLTWWKNNVERKRKLQSLKRDAASVNPGDYSARGRRALYCRIAVALALNIRNHFDRVIAENKGLIQVPIPSLTSTHPEAEKSSGALLGEETSLMDSIGLHLVDEVMFPEDRDQDETLREVMYSFNDGNEDNEAAFNLTGQ